LQKNTMNSPTQAANANQPNLAATIVDVNDFDTGSNMSTSPSSRACCGIARGLLPPLFMAAGGSLALAMGMYNAVLRHQYAQTSTENAIYSTGASIGLVAGSLAMVLAACLAKDHFAETQANNPLQNTPPAIADSPATPATPQPQASYTVITQPNQEIAVAVQMGSPPGRETP
jgi:hypothetical protein